MDHYCDADGNFDLEAAKEAYKNFLTTVPEENRIILRDFMDYVSYAEKEEKGMTFWYSTKDDTLYDNTKEKKFYGYSFEVACIHELSHRIDYYIVESWKDAEKLIFVEKNFPDLWSAFQRMHP